MEHYEDIEGLAELAKDISIPLGQFALEQSRAVFPNICKVREDARKEHIREIDLTLESGTPMSEEARELLQLQRLDLEQLDSAQGLSDQVQMDIYLEIPRLLRRSNEKKSEHGMNDFVTLAQFLQFLKRPEIQNHFKIIEDPDVRLSILKNIVRAFTICQAMKIIELQDIEDPYVSPDQLDALQETRRRIATLLAERYVKE
jgi:hypothetical protein